MNINSLILLSDFIKDSIVSSNALVIPFFAFPFILIILKIPISTSFSINSFN